MTRPQALATPARVLVGAVIVGGAAVLALRAGALAEWGVEELLAFAALAAATAAAEQFQLSLVHRRETENFALTDGVWTVGLMLAQPAVLAYAVLVGVLAGEGARRWAPVKIAYNAGQFLLGVGAAQVVYAALDPGSADEPRTWLAAALAMAAFFVVNTLLLGLVISLAEPKPLLQVLRPPLALDVAHWAGNLTFGILAAVVWTAEPLALPLLAVPLAMLFHAYRGWFGIVRRHELVREMARTAEAISEGGDLARRVREAAADDELGELAATLNRMLDRLEAAFRRERRFISEASHELRTPITICRGHLETLGDRPDPEDVRQAAAVLVAELDRMGRIVEDLTTLARAEGAGFVRPQPLEIGPFLADVGAAATPIVDGRLRIEPVPAGARVAADPQRLTQALLNLVQNAVLHGAGDGRVRLRAVPEPEAWRFEVDDEGGGLPPGEESVVFQPFARGRTAASGRGLGLAIVRGIAEAHAGAAGVRNRPGDGATFWIRVPRA